MKPINKQNCNQYVLKWLWEFSRLWVKNVAPLWSNIDYLQCFNSSQANLWCQYDTLHTFWKHTRPFIIDTKPKCPRASSVVESTLHSLNSYITVDMKQLLIPAFEFQWSNKSRCGLTESRSVVNGMWMGLITLADWDSLKRDICATDYVTNFSFLKAGQQDISAKSSNPRSDPQTCWSQFLESGLVLMRLSAASYP